MTSASVLRYIHTANAPPTARTPKRRHKFRHRQRSRQSPKALRSLVIPLLLPHERVLFVLRSLEVPSPPPTDNGAVRGKA